MNDTGQEALPLKGEKPGLADVLRVIRRVTLIAAWTVGLFLVRLTFMPLSLVARVTERRMRQSILRLWGRGIARIAGMRIEVVGTPPAPPFLLVSNHLSYADIVVYAQCLGCLFVSMAEVSSWPLIGWISKGMNTLFIDRKRMRDARRVAELIQASLHEGNGMLVFPESVTSPGETVLPFKPALLEPAVAIGLGVHYATLRYANPGAVPPASIAVCWTDNTPFGVHVLRLLRVPRFEARVIFGSEPIAADDRKELAARLRDAVAAQLDPVE